MGSDKIFKKSFFGGFKKDGVLNYVEQLQSEIVDLKKEISLNSSFGEEVVALKAENNNVVSETAALTARYDALKAENESLSERNTVLAQELDEAQKIIRNYEEKQTLFENKICAIENKFAQLANGYITNSASKSETKLAVETAKSEVNDANERLKTACNNFESSAYALKASVENLLKTLSGISEEIGVCSDKEE